MLYLAYEEPEWDGLHPPINPVIHGIFTSLHKIVEFLANKPLVGYEKYLASCYVILVKENEEVSKNYGWFDGVWISGSWLNCDCGIEFEKEAEAELLKRYNANLSSKS